MKKKVVISIVIFLVALIIAGVCFSMHAINETPKTPGDASNSENGELQELKVDFFGDFKPFECNGDYTSFSYISEVTNKEGTRFYAKSATEKGKHNNTLMYVLPNGDERTLFEMSDKDVDVEVMSYIDDALYFNVKNSKDSSVNGLYRMVLGYNENGEIVSNDLTMRFNLNLEPIRAQDNVLLLRLGEQYYTFDTQTGEYAPYN